MKTFTIQCEYPALYRNEVTVEAEDPVAACRTAIDVAGQSAAWKAQDCERPTYVVALVEGADVDPWVLTPEGADASVLPVPGCSRMWRGSRATPRPRARTWFSSSASCSMPSVMMAGCGSTRRR